MTTQQWADARSELSDLRRLWAPAFKTMAIRGRFRDPRSPGEIEGRGAIAFRHPDALRMMLVNPAGLTAFDLWIQGDRYRMAMPIGGRVWRGERPNKDLPVEFLRWWLLRPLEGRLTSATASALIVRDADASYEVARRNAASLSVIRRSKGETERIEATGPGCGTTRYTNERLHIEVTIACDASAESGGEPDARAFEDPDSVR
jgi:hypothetical protein